MLSLAQQYENLQELRNKKISSTISKIKCFRLHDVINQLTRHGKKKIPSRGLSYIGGGYRQTLAVLWYYIIQLQVPKTAKAKTEAGVLGRPLDIF